MSVVGNGLTGHRLLQPTYSDTSDEEDGGNWSFPPSQVASYGYSNDPGVPTSTSTTAPPASGLSLASMAECLPSIGTFSKQNADPGLFSPGYAPVVISKRKAEVTVTSGNPVSVDPNSHVKVPELLLSLAEEAKSMPSISGPTRPPKISKVSTIPVVSMKLGSGLLGNLGDEKESLDMIAAATTRRITRQSSRPSGGTTERNRRSRSASAGRSASRD